MKHFLRPSSIVTILSATAITLFLITSSGCAKKEAATVEITGPLKIIAGKSFSACVEFHPEDSPETNMSLKFHFSASLAEEPIATQSVTFFMELNCLDENKMGSQISSMKLVATPGTVEGIPTDAVSIDVTSISESRISYNDSVGPSWATECGNDPAAFPNGEEVDVTGKCGENDAGTLSYGIMKVEDVDGTPNLFIGDDDAAEHDGSTAEKRPIAWRSISFQQE